MSTSFWERADSVRDEASLLQLMTDMSKDWAAEEVKPDPGPFELRGQWGNFSIGAYLEAAAAWGADTKNGTPLGYVPPKNIWHRVAQILAAGIAYE